MAFEVGEAREVDHGKERRAAIGEAVAGRGHHFWRPAEIVRHLRLEEGFDRPPAGLGVEIACRQRLAISRNGQDAGHLVEAGGEGGEALVPHQHEEFGLGQEFRRGRVEARGPVLDGVGAVARNAAACRQAHAVERLGGEALHRVAVESGDAGNCCGYHLGDLTGLKVFCLFLSR
jgi:hypothetical protein